MDRISITTSRFFETQPKLEDIRNMIDNPSSSEREVSEGMKFLLAGISIGRDVSSLYPSVAKLAVSPNNEIKKMVYIYLVHYAEVEPEAALLAINTLKKELTNPNQLIRANALRTMSSIRVRIIAQLVGISVKQASSDSSPYVRKAAAHAVPKLVSLDPDQEGPMTDVIEILLNDSATMVLGSALHAFNEVCPDNWKLINTNYRKLCSLLPDLDEWGQLSALGMLTRYARTQFLDPEASVKKVNKEKATKADGEGSESSDDEEESDVFASAAASEANMDPDHRLLLKSALPLLQSRNVGVVLAVATLYHYLGPRLEQQKIAKSLIRTLRTRKEARYVLLKGILTFVEKCPDMFRPHLSDFFVEHTDPVYIRKIKIDIITLLANEGNISRILREFKIYVGQEDKDFVQASIQAIGQCAMRIPEVTETCMHSLTSLIGTQSEAAVAEAIVVIKKLLQVGNSKPQSSTEEVANGGNHTDTKSSKPTKAKYSDVIKHIAKLLDTVTNAQARASIAWIIAEYVQQLQSVAPDVLRKLAKSFPSEELIVKLQTLNLGVKLYLTNPEQTTLLFQYVLNLAKYDTSYDLRDRARLIRRVVFNQNDKAPVLHENAQSLFFTQKPVPSLDPLTPTDSEGSHFYPGSISSLLGHTVFGYQRVPAWTTEKPPAELRQPAQRQWEAIAYGSANAIQGPNHAAPVTAISWDQVPHNPTAHATSFGSTAPPPTAAAHTVAGFASREEYERNFWGDDSSEGSSRSRSGSTSSSGSSSSGSDSSDSDSDSETETRPGASDEDLFGDQTSQSVPSPQKATQEVPPPASDVTVAVETTSPPVITTTTTLAAPAAVYEGEEDEDDSSPSVVVASAEDFVPESSNSGNDWLNDDSS